MKRKKCWAFHIFLILSAAIFVSCTAQFATPRPSDELIFSSEWNENEEHAESLVRPEVALVRNYQSIRGLEFFWAGSGGGPVTTETDGGLAWEDTGPGVEDGPIIHVTKTKVLYKTVLSTIYPVEMTPTLVASHPHATPRLSPLPSPTAIVSMETPPSELFPSPTASIPERTLRISEIFPDPEKTTKPSSENHISDVLLNQLYWVQTIIRANTSLISSSEPLFTHEMQKNLARVYAAAFKRHLMSSLGILNASPGANLEDASEDSQDNADADLESGMRNSRSNANITVRRKREWLLLNEKQLAESTANFFYLANFTGQRLSPSQMQSLATAVLNVTVSIFNITQIDSAVPHVTLSYVVCAEGNPVLASSAVHDLNLVKKQEMEQEIGYEVINKAEALIASPLQEHKAVQIATSPWLIVAIISIIIMAILVIIIMVMVWKWKSNRLGDTGLHTSRSGIEGGIINPAFLGPTRLSGSSEAPPRNVTHVSRSVASPKQVDHHKHSPATTISQQAQSQQQSLASELDNLISSRKQRRPPSGNVSLSSGSECSSSKLSQEGVDDTPRRSSARYRTNSSNVRKTSPKRKPRRRDSDDQGHRRRKSNIENIDEFLGAFPQVPQVTDLDTHLQGKAVDKISYDDLEVCPEPIARPLSSKARKLLPQRGPGAKGRDTTDDPSRPSLKDVPETEEAPEATDNESIKEKDREITESLEHIPSIREPLRKDAAAQTPTRRKPKKSRKEQLSSESLISTESEEVFEIHHFDETEDQNPMGKMRKRFHQFLDDAFNVMGKKDDPEEGRAKSAKIWVSKSVETREVLSPRPLTAHSADVDDDDSTTSGSFRPKSASFGPPKTGWSETGSQDTLHPTTRSATGSFRGKVGPSRQSRPGTSTSRNEEISDYISTSVRPHAPSTTQPIFPNYPIYPDIPLPTQPPPTRTPLPSSPAVPLIMAIKEEIKRFEKIKTPHLPTSKKNDP